MAYLQPPPINVVIAEQKAIARMGLRHALKQDSDIQIAGETDTAEAALALVQQHAPQVLLTDFTLHGMPTIELIRQVRSAADCSTQVLVFTGNASRARVLGALSAGATGYLLKTEHTSAVVDAIRKLASNQTVLSQEVQNVLVELAAEQRFEITEREDQTFRLMALGVPDSEIAEQLGVSETTVRRDIQSICRKLPFIRSRAEATAWAWMNSLIRPADELQN